VLRGLGGRRRRRPQHRHPALARQLTRRRRPRNEEDGMSVEWLRLESSLWETAGALLRDGASAMLVDPGITPAEIDGIRERVAAAGATVEAILIAHIHADHTCGIGAFPDAEVAMGPLAADVVVRGDAARAVAA